MSETILKLEKLNYSYVDGSFRREILKDLDYEFLSGNFYTILGPSGSSKSTLLAIIAGLDTAMSGKVYYKGEDISKIGLSKYRRNNISIVFQQYNLIKYLTAVENVMLAFAECDKKVKHNHKKMAYLLLEKVGIVESKANRLVSKLSGGEQQRVAIARALAKDVEIIFADEPTGNLDSASEQEIVKLFKDLAKEYNKTIIIVTHSDRVSSFADERLLLEDGKLRKL